jgi:predicted Rossmann fold flavoprotein
VGWPLSFFASAVGSAKVPRVETSRPHLLVVGGGAAGFFGAIAAAEAAPQARVTLHEATAHPLAKVRISGGGRCNVTHACFEPDQLVAHYPRGGRELRGPFTRFGPRETIAWFAARGVALKTEADGRMFPVTDTSATIVQALQEAARTAGVRVVVGQGIAAVRREPRSDDTPSFAVDTVGGDRLAADRVLVATGGNRGSAGFAIAAALGHAIEPPVPSLFTFHCADPRLAGLAGLAVPEAEVWVPGTGLRAAGPVLITHWGLSGPAVLKLSAWGARELHARDYRFELAINWVGRLRREEVAADLADRRSTLPRRHPGTTNLWDLPGRLWERLVTAAGIPAGATWAGVSNAALQRLAGEVAAGSFVVTGKSANKEEFVTCGGVRLREVEFATMESRLCPGLHFAGEVLDIDGLTGGFNFQAAWTTGWHAGRAMARACGSRRARTVD